MGVFWRQFFVLMWKNWIILFRHPFLNFLRCFVLPVGYGVFLSVAQNFLTHPNVFGVGTSIPILELHDAFDARTTFYWVDNTSGATKPSSSDIISRITQDFTPRQLSAVRQLESPQDLGISCPSNFQMISQCFAAVTFNDIPDVGPVNYTIRADAGLAHIDVPSHQSDFELRILPLQWAIDRAIIELKTGAEVQTPIQWPFTQSSNADQDRGYRLKYIRGIRKLIVLALFVGYVGVAYQLPGAMAAERAQLITSHMKTMGLLDSARVLSWHFSLSLAYLPAWIVVAAIWQIRIFIGTNVGWLILVHVLFGLVLASWSFFIAVPFGKSPQLAAVASTFLAIIFAILALLLTGYTDDVFVTTATTIVFPPSFYIFAIRSICGFENMEIPTAIMKGDPENGVMLLPLLIAATVDILLWPWLSVLWERHLYDAQNPRQSVAHLKPGTAISITNLGKTYTTSILRGRRKVVTAVENLTFDIPKFGIFVLLGSNGAGKSTTLSILGGLQGRTRGSVVFEGGKDRPEPGTMGIVPQKNVLFPELTCLQTLKVWQAVKHSKHSESDEDLVQLLRDCDLGLKVHYNAAALSGGQKRKLQLAIGLVGGSKLVLVDECTSGVDPLSRRAIWRTLTSVRESRTIVFTTHFLDEADLLADSIVILAAPGKLVAEGSPVSLKREFGEGYSVQASLGHSHYVEKDVQAILSDVVASIREVSPHAYLSRDNASQPLFHLQTKDPIRIQQILQILDEYVRASKLQTYDILGTTLENIFLDLMNAFGRIQETKLDDHRSQHPSHNPYTLRGRESSDTLVAENPPASLELSRGRPVSPLRQAATIFYKRTLIARRSWLAPLLSIIVAVAGSTVPIVFLSDRLASCAPQNSTVTLSSFTSIPLYMPISPVAADALVGYAPVMNFPPGLISSSLGSSTAGLYIADVVDNATFTNTITEDFKNTEYGGISMNMETGASLMAWEAASPGLKGAVLLNLIDNILYNDAQAKSTPGLPGQGAMIQANYDPFPGTLDDTMPALKWAVFFGATMAVYPAFFALYVAQERGSSVQAMQFSNGLSDPLGLWFGHLAFDGIFSVVAAIAISVIYGTLVSSQFHGLVFFGIVLGLYGIAATLFSYCVSLVIVSPLAAFAATAGYQIVMFLCYFAAYLFTFTYAKIADENKLITILHFTLSVLSPVASVERAAFVSINLFSLLCVENETISMLDTVTIMRYGGPIVYLCIQIVILFIILVRPRIFRWRRTATPSAVFAPYAFDSKSDVSAEAYHTAESHDLLRVMGVSKTFGSNKVVDEVSLSADGDTIFALLGPNGAGKTTTFNMIRGDVIPDCGDVIIGGHSISRSAEKARFSLGVCPQFTAIDTQLTVKEHLTIYGRLKGLGNGAVLHNNVQSLLAATTLLPYADRLASKLSGGNQRKLSLAIALMGNPSVILIDEFSTGVDAKMKRDMWTTLKNVAAGKAVIITTHSMEEASALANKVGILAKRMLAVGTMESMASRYATYEVHFTCRTREEKIQTQILMSRIPGSRMADDVATRFEVPIGPHFTLSQLFAILSSASPSDDSSPFAVEKASLESIFLKVIKENQFVQEGPRT